MARRIRTTIEILDVQAKPSRVNEKGIQVDGVVMISIKVRYGRKHAWTKAYGFLPKDLKNFNMEDFKNRIFQESRVWIKEADLQVEALKKLKDAKTETIYLD